MKRKNLFVSLSKKSRRQEFWRHQLQLLLQLDIALAEILQLNHLVRNQGQGIILGNGSRVKKSKNGSKSYS